MNLEELSQPIPQDEIKTYDKKWTDKRTGEPRSITLSYIDARYVQEKLDKVCGPANWQNTFRNVEGGLICAIGIKVEDEWVWKEDAGVQQPEGMGDEIDFKGSFSDAFKRAAVQWGIGRDLYDKKKRAASKPVQSEQPQFSGEMADVELVAAMQFIGHSNRMSKEDTKRVWDWAYEQGWSRGKFNQAAISDKSQAGFPDPKIPLDAVPKIVDKFVEIGQLSDEQRGVILAQLGVNTDNTELPDDDPSQYSDEPF